MLTGVEHIDSRLEDYHRQKLRVLRPKVVKVRHPHLVPEVLDVLPDALILGRSPGEGYDLGDIADGYYRWLPVLRQYRDSILAYEFANEVNHPNRNADPVAWAQAVGNWLRTIDDSPVSLATPGLVPHVRINEWREALDTLDLGFAGIHAYWQQEGPAAGVAAALAQTGRRDGVLCTEMNTAHSSDAYHPNIAERAQECCEAMRALAAAGVEVAVVFALTGWQDWGFSYDVGDFARILEAGTLHETLHPPTKEAHMPRLDGSFEAKRMDWSAFWTPTNDAQLDGNGDWVQDFYDEQRKRWGLLREYHDEPGRVYVYWEQSDPSKSLTVR